MDINRRSAGDGPGESHTLRARCHKELFHRSSSSLSTIFAAGSGWLIFIRALNRECSLSTSANQCY